MRYILLLCLVLFQIKPSAQNFIQNPSAKALTFKEIQLQFDAFKKSHQLSSQKSWKHFKRYEMDMQMHTNGHGEPDGFADYIQAALEVAQMKEQTATSSAPWYPSGPNSLPTNLTGYMENGMGRVNCVAFHPNNPLIYYVGVAQGGLWKTTNGGTSYTPLTDNLPITRISDITLDPNNSNTIYISVCDFEYVGFGLYLNGRKRHTHYGLGVYKSTDAGLTWNATGLTFQLTDGDASLIRKTLVNPANSNELLACGVSGMYKSVNGGSTWTKKLDSLFWDLVQDPITPSIVYAAGGWVMNSNMGTAGIYKSSDFGNTWTLLNTGISGQGTVQRIKLAIAPSDPTYIYALCCDNTSGFYGIYQSTNSGTSWTYKPPILNILEFDQGNGPGGQGTYDLGLCVSATDKNMIYTGGVNLWGSADGGTTFNPISHWTLQYGNTLHGDIHAIDRQPGSNYIFVCSDGGIYKSNNIQTATWSSSWPTVWTKLTNGMQITSFYRLSSSKNNAGRLIAGAQDNASIYYNGTSWSTIFGGDGMDNCLSPQNNSVIVGSSQYGNFYYSNDGGVNGNFVSSNPYNEASEWVTPIVADYDHPGVMYLGNENVVKSTDGGQNWAALGTIYTNSVTQENTEISALAVSITNSNVIYATRRVRYEYNLKGIVIKSTNGGSSFTNITSNLPDSLYFTGVEVSPTNANEAVVCMAGFAGGIKVFKTTNGGSSWTNITYNLPNIPINCIKYVPVGNQLMIGCDVGVYLLNAGSTSWNSYSQGLPNVIVSDIEFNSILNKVYISTFGRGIWETNLSSLTSLQEQENKNLLNYSIFPTVNTGKFNIQINTLDQETEMMLFDVTGKVVYTNVLKEKDTQLNLALLPGIYFVKLESNGKMGVKKILVE